MFVQYEHRVEVDLLTFFYSSIDHEDSLGQRQKREQITLTDELVDNDEDNNALYTGEWLFDTDIRQGFGILVRKDGTRYKGYFYDNKFQGKGIFTFKPEDDKNRKRYIGTFNRG